MMINDIEMNPNKVNWASLVKHLLASLGFYNVWLNQSVGNDNYFVEIIRQRLSDNFIQNWSGRLENSTRASLYKNIAEFRMQPYLEILSVFKFCQSFTRLRVSSHRLQIESGRWVKPNRIPVNERLCSFCDVLEDEFHFVLECRQYENLRKQYIPKYYCTRPSMCKFIELLNTNNKNIVRKLSVFVFKAFETRNTLLYNNK